MEGSFCDGVEDGEDGVDAATIRLGLVIEVALRPAEEGRVGGEGDDVCDEGVGDLQSTFIASLVSKSECITGTERGEVEWWWVVVKEMRDVEKRRIKVRIQTLERTNQPLWEQH